MNILMEDSEVKEIKIEDILQSNDFGKVIIKNEFNIGRGPEIDLIRKEIIANDALELGPTRAAEYNGVSKQRASEYANGQDLDKDPDLKNRILDKKHNIGDLAMTKLMESLSLFNPTNLTKPSDMIKSAGILAGIVEKIHGRDDKSGGKIELHLYSPKQKNIASYDVIDV